MQLGIDVAMTCTSTVLASKRSQDRSGWILFNCFNGDSLRIEQGIPKSANPNRQQEMW